MTETLTYDQVRARIYLPKLRLINKMLPMSYHKIAVELNVSDKSVYRWITGKNSPSGLALEKIESFVNGYEF